MRKLIFALVVFITSNRVVGQEFSASAAIEKTKTDGFYTIVLTPDVSLYLNDRFSNLRIYDNDLEVPYILRSEPKKKSTPLFAEYEIVDRIKTKKWSEIVLSNPKKNTIDNISLQIRNAEVSKTASLLGSDDRKNWYALKQQFALSNINNTNGTSEIRIVDFPLSNYEFYSIRINDKKTAPLNIVRAGYYYNEEDSAQYHPVPSFGMSQADSTKARKSYVRLTFDTLRFVDRVTFEVAGSPYYFRRASLFSERELTARNGKRSTQMEFLSSVAVNSAGSKVIELPGVKTKSLLLIVENEDNPPLKFSSVEAFQLSRYITAWLKAEKTYEMRFGPQEMREPVYDLGFFEDSIPANSAVLKPGPVLPFGKQQLANTDTVFTNKMIIWAAIVLVIGVLGFMSVRLIRETNAVRKQG